MKKICKIAVLAGLTLLYAAGCGRNENSLISENETDLNASQDVTKNETEKTSTSSDEQTGFPPFYESVSESGKVTFQCTIEVPEDFNVQNAHKWMVDGRHLVDQEKAYSAYVDGGEIAEEHNNILDDGVEENIYIFEDGSHVSIGKGFTFTSKDDSCYLNIGVIDSDKIEIFSSDQVSFASSEDCINQIDEIVKTIGYELVELNYQAYPIAHQTLQSIEEDYISEGLLNESQKKDEWIDADDAYVIYAYQECGSLPVFHELMSLGSSFAYDSADNAPVQAIYSARGLEQLNIYYLYDFSETEELLTLASFDIIADVVLEKYEDILNDATYEITSAKLYMYVRINEDQEYEATPVWYFEVIENGTSRSGTLVDAVSGKEIYLG
ncbi:MAG: hypothetical protein LIO99_07665 [Clostridiales bacterium]|nr:hypothetical protein [Clostridiales bacterium]